VLDALEQERQRADVHLGRLAVILVGVSSATTYRTTYPFGSSGFWGDLKGKVVIKGLVKRLCRAPPGRKVCRKGWLRIRRPQVRVLPSAPLFTLQTGFSC
jgi:hypothetical protein